MDPMRSTYPPQISAGSSSAFAPTTTSLNTTAALTSTVNHPSNSCNVLSEPASQAVPPPLQASATCAAVPVMSQMQPLPQALNESSHVPGILAAPQGVNPETIPRSETAAAAAAQQPATLYPHQIDGVGGPTATAPFLQEFNLVAEAAKRAQMSIVMRDLESVTL